MSRIYKSLFENVLCDRLAEANKKIKTKELFKKGDISKYLYELSDISCVPHRKLNILLRINSTGHLTNIAKGRKKLSITNAYELASICKMKDDEKLALYEALPFQKLK